MSNSDRTQFQENRIDLSVALNFTPTPYLIINDDFSIAYVNFQALNLFRKYEAEFAEYMPNFNANNLINYKFFYLAQTFVEHEQALATLKLGQSLSLKMPVKHLLFMVKITRALAGNFQPCGYCLEWHDITQIANTKVSCYEALDAAIDGDFGHRIDESALDVDHHFKPIFAKINALLRKLSYFSMDILCDVEQIGQGDFSHSPVGKNMKNNFEDDYFTLIKNDLNRTKANLQILLKNVKNSAENVTFNTTAVAVANRQLLSILEENYNISSVLQASIDDSVNQLECQSKEIRQATEIAQIGRSSKDMIDKIASDSEEIRDQVNYLYQVSKTMERILTGHGNELKSGLKILEQGDFGAGVKIIKEVSNSMIKDSKDTMDNLQVFMSQVKSNISLMDTRIGHLSETIQHQIDMLTLSLDVINQSIEQQSNVFGSVSSNIYDLYKMSARGRMAMNAVLASSDVITRVAQDLEYNIKNLKLQMNTQNLDNYDI